jgi:hypothetical protein
LASVRAVGLRGRQGQRRKPQSQSTRIPRFIRPTSLREVTPPGGYNARPFYV